jgi:hypothetical protein
VVFLKEEDVILTNEVWRIAVDFDMGPYEELISTIEEDSYCQRAKNGFYVYF